MTLMERILMDELSGKERTRACRSFPCYPCLRAEVRFSTQACIALFQLQSDQKNRKDQRK